jgi:hypothetical protein
VRNLVSDSKVRSKLKVFEKKILRKISGRNRDEMIGGEENCIRKNFIFFYSHYI